MKKIVRPASRLRPWVGSPMPSSIRLKRVVVGVAASLILLLGAGRAIVGKAPRKQASLPKQIQQQLRQSPRVAASGFVSIGKPKLGRLNLANLAPKQARSSQVLPARGFIFVGKPKLGISNLPKPCRISLGQRVPLERSKPFITWLPKQTPAVALELPKKLIRGEARFHPRKNDKLIFIGRISRYGIPPQAVIICEGNLIVVEDRYGLSTTEARYGLEVIC